MGLFKSITGVAKKALGSVGDFRKALDLAPGLSGLAFPPQVSMGLKVAGIVGDAVGVDVPSEEEILDFATGKIKGALDDIISPIDKTAGRVEGTLTTLNGKILTIDSKLGTLDRFKGKTTDEILQSIDWLL